MKTIGNNNTNDNDVRLLDRFDALNIVLESVSKAYMVCGYQTDDKTLSATSATLLAAISDKRSSLTIGQFTKAMKDGSLGLLGDFAGISVKTMFQWIEAIIGHGYNLPIEEENETKALEYDKDAERIRLVQVWFDNWSCNRPIYFYPFRDIANWIHSLGITLTRDEQTARKQIENELLAQRVSDPSTRNVVSEALLHIDGSGQLRERIAKNAIIGFFKDCKDMDIEPKDVLTQKVKGL